MVSRGSVMKIFMIPFMMVSLLGTAFGQEGIAWTTSTSGGSSIDIPVFMLEGPTRALLNRSQDIGTAFEPENYPVWLRQYRTDAIKRPYVYLSETFGPAAEQITYILDKENIGVLSGYSKGRNEIFYAMCRKEKFVYCFDIQYANSEKSFFDPIVKRIARSFR